MKAGPKIADRTAADWATYRAAALASPTLPAHASEAQIRQEMSRIAYTAPYQNATTFNDGMQRELYERATNSEKTKLNN